jgi:hypothetical protein
VKKFIASSIALVAVFVGGMGVRAALDSPGIVGPPLIDRANAQIKLSGQLKPTTCVGVGGVKYETYFGAWSGGESQLLPDPTPRPLSGTLTVTGIQWTINLVTGRGLLTGAAKLSSASAGPLYSGRLTLITQGVPATGALVPARGWIQATVLPTKPPYFLFANVEFRISPTGATGQFGDVPGSLGIPDYSVVANADVC